MPRLYTGDLYDTEFMTIGEKHEALDSWEKFLANDLSEHSFTWILYNHLIQHCGFMAHYSIGGFYSHYFDDIEDSTRFLAQFMPESEYLSVEGGTNYWLNDSRYHDINSHMCWKMDLYKGKFLAKVNKYHETKHEKKIEESVKFLKENGYLVIEEES